MTLIKIPKKLRHGDKIGIISTARKISLTELIPAINILESWGLEVVFGRFLFEEYYQFAGDIKQRIFDLQSMIDDNSIKAILCARGGYGSVQIIDKIDFKNLLKKPKWIIGYSDVTVLHSHLNRIGIASLHASMPINFSKNTQESLESFKKCIFGIENIISTSSDFFNQIGSVEAEIVGGNLSVLYSLLGSDSDLDTEGKILFIEDLDEYLYHIDRMMMNMKRNAKFKGIKGMVIGTMCDMHDNDIPFGKTVKEIILAHTKDYNFPICFEFPCGHLEDNRAIILGAFSSLVVGENAVTLSQYL